MEDLIYRYASRPVGEWSVCDIPDVLQDIEWETAGLPGPAKKELALRILRGKFPNSLSDDALAALIDVIIAVAKGSYALKRSGLFAAMCCAVSAPSSRPVPEYHGHRVHQDNSSSSAASVPDGRGDHADRL